jgi:hypothetical protein
MKESNNKLYTKSYFIKRLIEKHFFIKHVVDKYRKEDTRYWTILACTHGIQFLITCIRENDKTMFRIFSENDVNILLETDSMDVLINTLFTLISKSNGSIRNN